MDQCEICDEGNEQGDEMAEFWSPSREQGIVAHFGCANGLSDWRLA